MIQDQTQVLAEQVRNAVASTAPMVIEGGNTKAFLGRLTQGEGIGLSEHRGIVAHEPSELVVTALAGTPLSELKAALHEAGQMLAETVQLARACHRTVTKAQYPASHPEKHW